MFNIYLFLIFLFLGIIIIYFTRYISLASVLLALAFPVFVYFYGVRGEILYISMGMGILAVFMHRANIKRLLSGTENKFSIKK